LQDRAPAHAWRDTERALEASLGPDWRDVLDVDAAPVGTGCVAQVHSAVRGRVLFFGVAATARGEKRVQPQAYTLSWHLLCALRAGGAPLGVPATNALAQVCRRWCTAAGGELANDGEKRKNPLTMQEYAKPAAYRALNCCDCKSSVYDRPESNR